MKHIRFVPIGDYHAGGDAAAFKDHPEEFEWALAQYLGAGTAACYRGGQLWNASTDTGAKIKAATASWVHFYKAHRETLIQPIVHLRRADMQDWDGWLHVAPFAANGEIGVAMIFNPTDVAIERVVNFPLYYTGATDAVKVSVDEGDAVKTAVGRDFSIVVHFEMAPRSIHTVVVSK